jgi:hypothetical protein
LCLHIASSLSSSSFKLVQFLMLRAIMLLKLLSHQQGSLSPWCCPAVSARLLTCVSLPGPTNQPQKLTKGGVLRRRTTSSLARLNHSCVRNA